MNFEFHLILINLNLNLERDTQFSYWKTLGMFGTTWVCESTFANANFMKLKYRSGITNENLAKCQN